MIALLFLLQQAGIAAGEFEAGGVPFRWQFSSEALAGAKDLYALKVTVEWKEGGRPQALVRELYAAKPVRAS